MSSPQETIRLIAHTEPAMLQFGRDPVTGEALGYAFDRVVALTHSEGDVHRHVGSEDVEMAPREALVLPREIGLRVLDAIERTGEGCFKGNCHRFAREITGHPEASHPVSLVHPDERTTELAAGEIGQIGSPARDNGQPEHSLVSVGNGKSIEVGGLSEPIGLVRTNDVVDYYRKLRPGEDAGLYRPLPEVRRPPVRQSTSAVSPSHKPSHQHPAEAYNW